MNALLLVCISFNYVESMHRSSILIVKTCLSPPIIILVYSLVKIHTKMWMYIKKGYNWVENH